MNFIFSIILVHYLWNQGKVPQIVFLKYKVMNTYEEKKCSLFTNSFFTVSYKVQTTSHYRFRNIMNHSYKNQYQVIKVSKPKDAIIYLLIYF